MSMKGGSPPGALDAGPSTGQNMGPGACVRRKLSRCSNSHCYLSLPAPDPGLGHLLTAPKQGPLPASPLRPHQPGAYTPDLHRQGGRTLQVSLKQRHRPPLPCCAGGLSLTWGPVNPE